MADEISAVAPKAEKEVDDQPVPAHQQGRKGRFVKGAWRPDEDQKIKGACAVQGS